jgi:hypothetical protein
MPIIATRTNNPAKIPIFIFIKKIMLNNILT